MLPYFNFGPHHGSALWSAYFTTPQPNRLNRLYHQPAHAILLRQRFAHKGGTGISTSCPSPTTGRMNLSQETLGFRRQCFSHCSRYSYRHSLYCTVHGCLRYRFSPYTMLLYRSTNLIAEPEASVVCFSPVTSSAHNHSTSELLRTL